MKLEPVGFLEQAIAVPARAEAKGGHYAVALVLSGIFWLFAWYFDTLRVMVEIWERSETFAHGFIIVPISAWLIWRRRHDLATLDLRPNLLVLPLLGLAGFVWLMGELGGTGVVQQYAVVAMIPLLVWTILGNQVLSALAFPFFFLMFAVPFGEFLLPPLMEFTAGFIIGALKLTGIPVYREGLFFTVPSGSWSVVEACAGLRYLIASVTLGFLYAYLTYRSLTRRVIFVAFSIIVPIVANWLRAYMIVMIGHLSSMKYAVGVDHLIYGWIFFGVVMLILFWVGSLWREDHLPQQPVAARDVALRRAPPALTAITAATVFAALLVAAWPFAASRLEFAGPYAQPALHAPPAAGMWQPVEGHLAGWMPRFINPAIRLNQTYAADGKPVGLYLGYYRNQRQGAELITSQNVLVHSSDSLWGRVGETRRSVLVGNEKLPLLEAKVRGRSTYLLAWQWYWVDGEYTVNPYRAKFLQAKSKLLGRGDDAAMIVVYTEMDVDSQGAAAAASLQQFLSDMLPGITKRLNDAR